MKLLALDLGDRWVGSAVADPLGITCRPYKTVELENLAAFLTTVLPSEGIGTVVVGYPRTVGTGGQSEQTKRIVQLKESLEKEFGTVAWILWDERLSSKRASNMQTLKQTQNKQQSHSIAAAFILQSYLDYLAFQKAANSDI